MLALVGVVNVPIIYFSVKWWNTLHQGSSGQPDQVAVDGGDDALGHAADGAVLLDVRDRRRLHAGARRSCSSASAKPTWVKACWRRRAMIALEQRLRIPRHGRLRPLRLGLAYGVTAADHGLEPILARAAHQKRRAHRRACERLMRAEPRPRQWTTA